MNCQEAIRYLTGFPAFDPKAVAAGTVKMNLDAVSILLDKVGHPENRLKFIHIAGTNGKGSTAAFIQQILLQAKIQTGFFTSPYIYDWREQIRVNDQWIDMTSLAELTTRVKNQIDTTNWNVRPSAYEISVVIALLYFVKMRCELVLLEVGLGGRMDATNAIPVCELAVITSIGLDHMELLGDTIEKIADQKAGIIKAGCDVVVYPQQPSAYDVIRQVCIDKKARLFPAVMPTDIHHTTTQIFKWNQTEIEIHMLGTYQVYNASLALSAVSLLQKKGYTITKRNMIDGCAYTQWPARFELIRKNPPIIVDGAHNSDGVQALIKSIYTYFPHQKINFVCGILADKNYQQMIDTIIPCANRIYTVTPDNPRALSAVRLSEYIKKKGIPSIPFDRLNDCLDFALKQNDILCIFGSLYYVGFARKYILEQYPK